MVKDVNPEEDFYEAAVAEQISKVQEMSKELLKKNEGSSKKEPVGSVENLANGYKLDRIYNVLNHIRWIGLSIAMMLALSFIVPLSFS